MDWYTLIKDNFAAIGTLAGVIIGLLGAFVQAFMTKRLDLKQKELDAQRTYREKNLVSPIITFVDEMLQMMDKAYWDMMDGNPPGIDKNLVKHRDKEGMIKARISAFSDEELVEAFNTLSVKYGRFWGCLRQNELSKAYDEKEEAHKQAGIIFDGIKPRLTK